MQDQSPHKVEVCVSGCVSLPETALGGLRTELPSGGPSPTMLGSWTLGEGEYAGGLDPCSWNNFFGTSQQKSIARKKRGGCEESELMNYL